MANPWDLNYGVGANQKTPSAPPKATPAPKKVISRNELLDKVAKAYVGEHAGSGFDAMRAGANQAFFGLPDLAGAVAGTIAGPTRGNFQDSLHLQRAITKEQIAAHPNTALATEIPTSLLSGNAVLKGISGVGHALQEAPGALKAVGQGLSALTDFKAAEGATKAAKVVRVASNLAKGAGQGALLGGAQAAGTGQDIGGGVVGGGVAGTAGAAIGEGGGAVVRRLRNLVSADVPNAARTVVREDPQALAARVQDLQSRSGNKIPLAAALSPEDLSRVKTNVAEVSPQTRATTVQGYQARVADTPRRVAQAVNQGVRTADIPEGMQDSPIADMVMSDAVRSTNPNVGRFKDIQRNEMDAAMRPLADTRLNVGEVPVYGAEADVLNRAIQSSPSLRAQIPQNGAIHDMDLSVRDLDSLKQQIAKDSRSNSLSPGDQRLHRNVSEVLTQHIGNNVPEYVPAVNRWGAQQRLIEGFQAGQNKINPQGVEVNYRRDNLESPEGRLGQQIGTFSGVRNAAATSPEGAISTAQRLASGSDLTRPVSPEFGVGGQITETAGPQVAARLQERAQADTEATQNLKRLASLDQTKPKKGSFENPADMTAAASLALGSTSPWAWARGIVGFAKANGVSEKAARGLSAAIMNPENTEALLRDLRKEIPNKGHLTQFIRSAVQSVNDVNNETLPLMQTPEGTESAPAAQSAGNPWDDNYASPEDQPAPQEPQDGSVSSEASFADFLQQTVPGAVITSGQRSPERNAAVGGVSNSAHLDGNAADIVPPTGMSFHELHDILAPYGFYILPEKGNKPSTLAGADHLHVNFNGGR